MTPTAVNQTILDAERSMNECCAKSIQNFATLSQSNRDQCIKRLRKVMHAPGSAEALTIWKAQVEAGQRIGNEDSYFHFSTGMQIRNVLRKVVYDHDLPPIEQPGGDYASNWDDYYYGALHAAVSEELVNG